MELSVLIHSFLMWFSNSLENCLYLYLLVLIIFLFFILMEQKAQDFVDQKDFLSLVEILLSGEGKILENMKSE